MAEQSKRKQSGSKGQRAGKPETDAREAKASGKRQSDAEVEVGKVGKAVDKRAAGKADKKSGKTANKPAEKGVASKRKSAKDRIEVRESGVHGKGVYAIAPIAEGERIIEYKGERISWETALDRHPHDPNDPNHTFYFSLEDGDVLDAKYGGNRSRWINHACEPNCEAREQDGRVFIHALRDIQPGEELFYDYGLVIDGRQTKKLKKEFACYCGSPNCRGTMLAPKGKR